MDMVVVLSFFPLVVLWIVVDRLRHWRQSFGKARMQVAWELGKPRPAGEPAQVTVWSAYPLSDHMIKELAADAGFRYLGEKGTYNGARALAFQPPKQPKRKLSLDV